MRYPIAVSLLFLLSVSGCTSITKQATQADTGIDGEACVGSIEGMNPALETSSNATLLGKAQQPSGKGGTCAAKVVSVNSPVVLYRVFDASKPYSKFGSWWALDTPTGPKDSYRAAFAICPEWSNLDRVVSCEVRPGTQLVIGTTQSATCADGSVLPKTKEIQVFVPNDGKVGINHVGACSAETAWP